MMTNISHHMKKQQIDTAKELINLVEEYINENISK